MRLTFDPSRDPTQPPSESAIEAEHLFRLLLRSPRAELPITYRIPAAPHIALRVVALSGNEESSAWDDARSLRSEDARDAELVAGLIVRSLHTRRGRAFANVGQVGELEPHNVSDLASHVIAALCVVSPTYGSIDQRAWELRLEKGATHLSNAHQAAMLADCIDVSLASGVRYTTPRPDRYFGLRMGELTDGQLLVFRAARSVVQARRDRAARTPG